MRPPARPLAPFLLRLKNTLLFAGVLALPVAAIAFAVASAAGR